MIQCLGFRPVQSRTMGTIKQQNPVGTRLVAAENSAAIMQLSTEVRRYLSRGANARVSLSLRGPTMNSHTSWH